MYLARHLSTLFLILMLFFVPWWFFGVLSIIFISIFPKYYESVGLGFIGDILYGGVLDSEFLNVLTSFSSYLYTLSIFLIVLVVDKIKTYIIFYK